MKVNKSKHPLSKTYMCEECVFVFTIHSKMKFKRIHCPKCGDHVSVNIFEEAPRKMKEWRAWTDEEYELIDRIVKGELQKYQVAARLNRTYGSVQRKVEQRKKKLEKEV